MALVKLLTTILSGRIGRGKAKSPVDAIYAALNGLVLEKGIVFDLILAQRAGSDELSA